MADSSRRFHFTKKEIEALPLPAAGTKVWFRDAGKRGLCLEVTSAGNRTFWLRRTQQGRRHDQLLGRFPDLTIKEARDEVDLLSGEIARDGTTASRRMSVRGALTLDEYFDSWLERHGKPHRPGTWRHDENLYTKHIKPALGQLKLPSVGLEQVQTLHVTMGRKVGHRTANRMLQLVSIMFSCARQWKLINGANPTEGIKRFPEMKIERFLAPSEVPVLFAAVRHEDTPPDARDLVLLAFFTGARKGNLQRMRWQDLDLDSATWAIPASETKTNRVYFIPLAQPALVILQNRLACARPGTSWVFPARRGDGAIVLNHKVWADILTRAGIKNLRFHDLRHNLASWQAMAGVSLPIIGRALGHSSATTTQRYAHLNMDPVRSSVEGAVAALVQAGDQGKQVKVQIQQAEKRGKRTGKRGK